MQNSSLWSGSDLQKYCVFFKKFELVANLEKNTCIIDKHLYGLLEKGL